MNTWGTSTQADYFLFFYFIFFLKENKINMLSGTNEERVEPNYMARTQKAQKKWKSTKANKKGSLASLSMPKLSTKSEKYTLGSFKSECSTASKTLEFVSFHKHQIGQLRTCHYADILSKAFYSWCRIWTWNLGSLFWANVCASIRVCSIAAKFEIFAPLICAIWVCSCKQQN